jgi:hypothetical protein
MLVLLRITSLKNLNKLGIVFLAETSNNYYLLVDFPGDFFCKIRVNFLNVELIGLPLVPGARSSKPKTSYQQPESGIWHPEPGTRHPEPITP